MLGTFTTKTPRHPPGNTKGKITPREPIVLLGMKRECELPLKQEALRAMDIPIELLYPMAWQLDIADTGAVLRFMLVCHTARNALQPVLAHWYREMNRICTEKLSSNTLFSTLGRRISNMHCIITALQMPWPLHLEPEKTPDAILCLYYTGHCKQLFSSGVDNTIRNGNTMECHCTVAYDEYENDSLRKVYGNIIEYYGHVHWQALRCRFKQSLQLMNSVPFVGFNP